MTRPCNLVRVLAPSLALAAALGGCTKSGPDCDAPGVACTWAGIPGVGGFGVPGKAGENGDGVFRLDTKLYFPMDVSFAPDGTPYIVDWNNHAIRRVEKDGTLTTVIGNEVEGDGSPGETDRLPVGSPMGAPGTDVELNHPTNIAWLPDGTMLLAAWHNNKVRQWDPATGIVKVVAGDNYCYPSEYATCSGDGGPAANAEFNLVRSVVVDAEQNIYVLDQANERIRVITTSGSSRTINTYAGDGMRGYAGDGATVQTAEFNLNNENTPFPSGGLAVWGRTLFISDAQNNRVRRIDLDSGKIDCVAGNGTAGYAGVGGPAVDAELSDPADLEIGPDSRLYIADRGNNAIRAIDLTSGDIETVAGTGKPCPAYPKKCLEASEGLSAHQVQLRAPTGVAFDRDGNMYIADWNNHRIVRIAQ